MGEQNIVICLSVYMHISETTYPNLCMLLVAVAQSFWLCCNMFCISSSIDDVMFTNNGQDLVMHKGCILRSSIDLISQRILKLTHQGQHQTGVESDMYDCLVMAEDRVTSQQV